MFEIIICCIIVFAVGYWATLWAAGRREDVLHGQFVELQAQPEPAPVAMPTPPPKVPTRPAPPQPKLPVNANPPANDKVPPIAKAPANAEALNSLLVSLKRELKNAARL